MALLAHTDGENVAVERISTVASDVRWLSQGEQITWHAFLSAVQLLLERLDRRLLREAGLVLTHYEMLVQLSQAPERTLRMSELAERSLSSRSRVSHAVARMQDRGWIRRQTCPTDGRGYLAVLTDEGSSVLEAAAPLHSEMVRDAVLDHLGPDQVGQLRDISLELLEHLVSTGDVYPLGAPQTGREHSLRVP